MKGEGPENFPDFPQSRDFVDYGEHGGRAPVSDRELSAELKNWTGAAPALHPVGELLDRHWAAGYAYARLCTAGPRAAGMLTTAAFTRLFGETLRQAGPSAAWRPHLLVTVRRVAAEWDGDGRQDLLHPALLPGPGSTERAAARLLPSSGRRLLSRAFQRLPQSYRAVLWHAEVEGEPLSVPAELLGLDEENTLIELRRARERLREECLQTHRELAADPECGRYLRMLDVTFRRGALDMDPDLRAHLEGCRHCMETAEQLARFKQGLGLALAESVLGWGAAEYREARAHRAEETPAVPALTGGEDFEPSLAPFPGLPPAHRTTTASGPTLRSAHRAARRARRRNLGMAVATVGGLVVLPLVLWSAFGSGDDSARAHGATPSEAPDTPPTPGPSWAGASTREGALHGRLHNVASGDCVGVVGKAVKGAETELASCSSTPSQRWTYETSGLLRSDAAPDLCLDSHLGYSVRLAPCSATGRTAKNLRYDFTLQGVLVPRWDQDLALTPAATDGSGALVVKNREDTGAQHWVMDTSHPDPQMQSVGWDGTTPPAKGTSSAPATPGRTAVPAPTRSATPTPAATPTEQPGPTREGFPVSYRCADHQDACFRDGHYGDRDHGGSYGSYGGSYGDSYGGSYGGTYGGRRR
ncbi:ricin-type beta-trefoil lectin domain protein [Streptomyces sp. DSM 110735]|uniref:RICIN domain-containing protein n=1 Tax=Streptomyces sp. DSM 110735 TaxID=2775031 RepID=UPI0018F6C30B|nr:RICIN domain-containing protein [Streptomyces sp. DSM 110735]MBJ7902873.1 ricin-type beta-trefoil lectin domain protein [Streptomyces sp. DSM 110735]